MLDLFNKKHVAGRTTRIPMVEQKIADTVREPGGKQEICYLLQLLPPHLQSLGTKWHWQDPMQTGDLRRCIALRVWVCC